MPTTQPLPELYEQSRGCPTQAPLALQVPPTTHELLAALQLVPTGLGSVHVCVVSLQVRQPPPEVEQSICVPTQFPLKSHWSPVVQNLASLQGVPYGCVVPVVQFPNCVSLHTEPVRQPPLFVSQFFGVPTQSPFAQVSSVVQYKLSSHVAPSL
jgi:hypothetical protein